MDELRERSEKAKQVQLERLKKRYTLARKLGFSSSEAVVLQSRKEDNIIALAIERGFIKDSSDPKIQG